MCEIVVPMKPYLAKKGDPPKIVERMYNAWWNQWSVRRHYGANPISFL